jgi:hypothetical protein
MNFTSHLILLKLGLNLSQACIEALLCSFLLRSPPFRYFLGFQSAPLDMLVISELLL